MVKKSRKFVRSFSEFLFWIFEIQISQMFLLRIVIGHHILLQRVFIFYAMIMITVYIIHIMFFLNSLLYICICITHFFIEFWHLKIWNWHSIKKNLLNIFSTPYFPLQMESFRLKVISRIPYIFLIPTCPYDFFMWLYK